MQNLFSLYMMDFKGLPMYIQEHKDNFNLIGDDSYRSGDESSKFIMII